MKIKHSLFPLLFLCFSAASQAQQTKDEPEELPITKVLEDDQVYNSVEIKPEFPGGMEAFYKYISGNYQIPEEYVNGTIYVTFVIEKDGSLSEVKVLRDLGYGTGTEAIRMIKNSPIWKPGMQNGRTVRTQFSLPIKLVVPDVPSADEKVYDNPEIAPEYPGGTDALYTYIREKFTIPEHFKGRSEIKTEFIIEKDGSVKSVWINNDIGGDAASHIKQILLETKWSPGRQGGKPVRTHYFLPIKVDPK